MKLEELLRTFIGIGSWIYRINLYEVDSKDNTKYITDHHMIDYYVDMNNFKDWFDMEVENFSVIPYGYGNNIENGIKRWLVDIYVKAEVKNGSVDKK